MNEMEPFEQRLKRQTLRPAPDNWREEILLAARQAQPLVARVSKSADHPIGRPPLRSMAQRLTSLLWPHPVAWGALAAVWIFIFMANYSMRDQSPTIAEKTSPPSPEMIAELHQQQRLLVELIGANDSGDADRPKVIGPSPRSERVAILAA